MRDYEKSFVRGFAYSFVLDRLIPGGSILVLIYNLFKIMFGLILMVFMIPGWLMDLPYRFERRREPNTQWEEYKKTYLQG